MSRGVRNVAQSDPPHAAPIFLRRHHNQRLSFCSASTRSLRLRAKIGLINLHAPRQKVAARPDHGPTQLVQPTPGGFIAPQSQYVLQPQCAGSAFLTCHTPHCAKPEPQRLAGVLQDRSRRDRGLIVASGALIQSCSYGPSLPVLASWANEPIGPAQVV